MTRVLGFGTYDAAVHPRIGIVLDGLREHGDEVVEVNAPLGFSTAERIEMVRRPWLLGRLVARLAHCWGQLTRRAIATRRPYRAVIVGYLGQFDVLLARVLFPRDELVLDLLVFGADTAADRGLGGTARRYLLGLVDRSAIRVANTVLVDTDENRELIPLRHQHKAIVVAVGAPSAWFATAERPADEVLRVVFFGLFTPLQGVGVIAAALAQLAGRADIEVTMIGVGQQLDIARSIAAPNPHVQWLDWVAPETLPALVATFDVCLGIFGTSRKALRVVPNKVYQGAAAGCAIVTSDTPPQRRALGAAAEFVSPGNAVALAATLGRLADDRHHTTDLGTRAHRLALAEFTPGSVVAPLREALK
jgi:glycosyltransferase involved in cell wall biosynthesis